MLQYETPSKQFCVFLQLAFQFVLRIKHELSESFGAERRARRFSIELEYKL
jgi:hypothetical protein